MTIDDLRSRKRELLDKKKRLQDSGADPLAIQLLSEELLDVNAQLRRMTPGHRIGTKKVSDASLNRKQYQDWASRTWSELEAAGVTWEEAESGTARLREAVHNAGLYLTAAEKRYFDLYAAGKRQTEIAALCGVNDSTVSRSIAAIRRKLRDAAEHLKYTDSEYEGEGARIDASDPGAAKMLISACTPLQIVYKYLYYGEWLSCAEIGRLLDVDKTAALRGVTRGLRSIGRLFPGKELVLDNMDALGELAYAFYMGREWEEAELTPETPEPGRDWGRRFLGLASEPPSMNYADRPEIMIGTPDGGTLDVRERRVEIAGAPKGRLLLALLERWRDRAGGVAERGQTLRRWLTALFEQIKNQITGG